MAEIIFAGQPAEVAVFSVSPATARITVRPLEGGVAAPIPVTGALVQDEFGPPIATARVAAELNRVSAGDLVVRFAESPPTLLVETRGGDLVQRLTLDAAAPEMSFQLPRGRCSDSAKAGRNSIARDRSIGCATDRAGIASRRTEPARRCSG
jgi:hypothetical protein